MSWCSAWSCTGVHSHSEQPYVLVTVCAGVRAAAEDVRGAAGRALPRAHPAPACAVPAGAADPPPADPGNSGPLWSAAAGPWVARCRTLGSLGVGLNIQSGILPPFFIRYENRYTDTKYRYILNIYYNIFRLKYIFILFHFFINFAFLMLYS